MLDILAISEYVKRLYLSIKPIALFYRRVVNSNHFKVVDKDQQIEFDVELEYKNIDRITIDNFLTSSPLMKRALNGTLLSPVYFSGEDVVIDKTTNRAYIDMDSIGCILKDIIVTEPIYDKDFNYKYIHPSSIIKATAIPVGVHKELVIKALNNGDFKFLLITTEDDNKDIYVLTWTLKIGNE